MLLAIILAAGSSRRMLGRNKLLLSYGNKTFVETVASNVINAGITDIVVVTGFEANLVSERVRHLPVKIVYNSLYEQGMTSSIQAGISGRMADGYMICLSDMVAITTEEYAKLTNVFYARIKEDPHCIILPRYEGRKGNPVIFSSCYHEDILACEEKDGCRQIVTQNPQHVHWVDMESPGVLLDIDSPEDYGNL